MSALFGVSVLTALVNIGTASAETTCEAQTCTCKCEDKGEEEPARFEFSLATSHPVPAEHIGKYGDNIDIVPSSGILLLLDYFISYHWRARFMYDLATTTDKRIVSGEVQEEVIPSSMSLGLSWIPWTISFAEKSRVEFQGTLYTGFILTDKWKPFPTWTGRVQLMQDANAGVSVYLGAMYAFRRNTAGPIYGVGYRF